MDLFPSPAAERVLATISRMFRIPAARVRVDSRLDADLGLGADERAALWRELQREQVLAPDARAAGNLRTVRQVAGAIYRDTTSGT